MKIYFGAVLLLTFYNDCISQGTRLPAISKTYKVPGENIFYPGVLKKLNPTDYAIDQPQNLLPLSPPMPSENNTSRFLFSAVALYHYSQQEFVTASSSISVIPDVALTGSGTELSMQYSLCRWLQADCNLSFSIEKETGSAAQGTLQEADKRISGNMSLNFIPGSFIGGLVNFRLMDGSPLIQTNPSAAGNFLITDFALSVNYKKTFFTLSFNNIIKRNLLSHRLITESRLHKENRLINQFNFTPTIAGGITGTLVYNF